MVSIKENYRLKGITEGYFNVRLVMITDKDLEIRESFIEGFKEGIIRRKSLKESQKADWARNRMGYIRNTGYISAYEGYEANGINLKGEDLEVFNQGLIAGQNQKEADKILRKETQKVRKIEK